MEMSNNFIAMKSSSWGNCARRWFTIARMGICSGVTTAPADPAPGRARRKKGPTFLKKNFFGKFFFFEKFFFWNFFWIFNSNAQKSTICWSNFRKTIKISKKRWIFDNFFFGTKFSKVRLERWGPWRESAGGPAGPELRHWVFARWFGGNIRRIYGGRILVPTVVHRSPGMEQPCNGYSTHWINNFDNQDVHYIRMWLCMWLCTSPYLEHQVD